jgi:hypothetical protein
MIEADFMMGCLFGGILTCALLFFLVIGIAAVARSSQISREEERRGNGSKPILR